MAKHHPDLIFCRKQAGVAIGRLCEKCEWNSPSNNPPFPLPVSVEPAKVPQRGDGKCVICDSYVRPCTLVRICDECNYGSYQGRCVICGGPGVSDAYYCKECTIQEKDVIISSSSVSQTGCSPLDAKKAVILHQGENAREANLCQDQQFGEPSLYSFYVVVQCLTYGASMRDGCPKIVNLGSSKTDLFYERKKYGFKKR
ncbi:hypothetical protein P7K49_002507 [Saguinus oedipus]|uniref:PHD finger-like domain-containing protein 5A n=1 Tax=Saguinus oedipus TaxID=9490 RepID=A0ABQ9WHJ5_SAGOE|nr:hypothetical protein P7K49_002507 [Saguinus oedipus]